MPASEVVEQVTRAVVLRERYIKGTYTRILKQLLASEAKLLRQLESRLAGLTGADRVRFQRDDWTTRRLIAVRESIQDLANKYRTVMNGEIRTSARDLIAAETQLALSAVGTASSGVKVISDLSGAVSEYQIYTAAMSQPFNGRIMREYMQGVEQGVRRRVLQSLRTSFANGESVPDAVSAIRGTQARGYADGVMAISRRSANTLVRTTMTHMAARTQESIYTDLGVDYVEYIATLDSRTSGICRGLSRKIFKVGTNFPHPPQHFNCRSSLMPVIEGYDDTGEQTARGPSGKTELVDSGLNYGKWLKTQPREFIDEVLGKTKARLFLDGGLTMDKFVDLRQRREYTIAELRSKYAMAFKSAKIGA